MPQTSIQASMEAMDRGECAHILGDLDQFSFQLAITGMQTTPCIESADCMPIQQLLVSFRMHAICVSLEIQHRTHQILLFDCTFVNSANSIRIWFSPTKTQCSFCMILVDCEVCVLDYDAA